MSSSSSADRRWWRSPTAVGSLTVSLAVVAFAERDIQRRSRNQIKGSKLLWRLLSLNALGALAYLRWGRAAGELPRSAS
jgi:hypothetical protein